MKILITGATGFLGGNLARELYKAGEDVKLLLRPTSDCRGIDDLPCEIFYGDITNCADINKAVEDVDAVIHTAATTNISEKIYQNYEWINVKGTENLVKALSKHNNKKLIYVSTANTFGPGTKANPGTELSEFSLFNYNSGYINSKYIAQQYVLEAVEKHNLQAIVVNPTFMIGPYDVKPSSGKLLLYGLKNKIIWCPPGGKNFVHVRDVAKGIYKILLDGSVGQSYLLAGENLSYCDFFTLLNEVSGKKNKIFKLPKSIMYGAGITAELWSKINKQQMDINLTNSKLACLDNYYCGNKAIKSFDLKLTPVSEAIEEAITWFEAEGYI